MKYENLVDARDVELLLSRIKSTNLENAYNNYKSAYSAYERHMKEVGKVERHLTNTSGAAHAEVQEQLGRLYNGMDYYEKKLTKAHKKLTGAFNNAITPAELASAFRSRYKKYFNRG